MSCISVGILYAVGSVVVNMRRFLPSFVGKISSSRQSPKRSADKAGVDFVPFTLMQPVAVKIVSAFEVS